MKFLAAIWRWMFRVHPPTFRVEAVRDDGTVVFRLYIAADSAHDAFEKARACLGSGRPARMIATQID